jgi:hypothetical protein
VPAVSRDDIGVEVTDARGAAELAGQPVAEGAEDRGVLPPRARRRRPGGDPLGLREQVALLERGRDGRRGKGERQLARAPSPEVGTNSASTASNSPSATKVSESGSSLTANAYSRNGPCRVTLNRASDGSTTRMRGVREAARVRKKEF